MDVTVDRRLLGIELPRRQRSVLHHVGALYGFEELAVISADGVDVVAVYRRLQTAPRRGEIRDALPGSETAVGEDGRAFHHGAGYVVLTASAVGAADGV